MKNTIIFSVAFATLAAVGAWATPKLQILPTPVADRTFQFVKPGKSFLGTPLEVDSLTPHTLFVVGRNDSGELFVQAATMAFMVG